MSGARGGRKKKGHAEEEHPDERWLASYMDMVTVLMCMFIVLFAMSSVDQDKYIALRNSPRDRLRPDRRRQGRHGVGHRRRGRTT